MWHILWGNSPGRYKLNKTWTSAHDIWRSTFLDSKCIHPHRHISVLLLNFKKPKIKISVWSNYKSFHTQFTYTESCIFCHTFCFFQTLFTRCLNSLDSTCRKIQVATVYSNQWFFPVLFKVEVSPNSNVDWVSRKQFYKPNNKIFEQNLDKPFKRTDYAKFCMSASLDKTLPESDIPQENKSPSQLENSSWLDYPKFAQTFAVGFLK